MVFKIGPDRPDQQVGSGTNLPSSPIHPKNRLAKEPMEVLLNWANQLEAMGFPVCSENG